MILKVYDMITFIKNNSKVLLIGNSVKEVNYVKTINEKDYDYIIGFNHQQYKDIKKCDIIFHNLNIKAYTEDYLKKLKENNTKLISRFSYDFFKNSGRESFFVEVNKKEYITLNFIDGEIFNKIYMEYGGNLTTGFIAAIYFLQYMNCLTHIVGFDFYRKMYSGESPLPTAPCHDITQEYKYFKKIVIPMYNDKIKFIGSIERYMYD